MVAWGRLWALGDENRGVIGRVGVLEGGTGAGNALVDGGDGLEDASAPICGQPASAACVHRGAGTPENGADGCRLERSS